MVVCSALCVLSMTGGTLAQKLIVKRELSNVSAILLRVLQAIAQHMLPDEFMRMD